MNSALIKFDEKAKIEDVDRIKSYISLLEARGLPVILDGDHLSHLIGVEKKYIFKILNSPSLFYRRFQLRKSSGGRRNISAPMPLMLLVQRWILDEILYKVEPHIAAKAYTVGRSVKDNARLHRAQKIIIKMDVKDFFGSINFLSIVNIFEELGYLRSTAIMLSNLCCLDGVLPQGAPTSGCLSNLYMKTFDRNMYEFCRENKFRYSRYADDITVSGDIDDQHAVINRVVLALSDSFLRINNSKTRVLKDNNRKIITGIVVNNTMSVRRDYYKKIRQELYFIKSNGIYQHAIKNGLNDIRLYLDGLIGRISFVIFITKKWKHLEEDRKYLLKMRNEIS